jgi:hypothetical protein
LQPKRKKLPKDSCFGVHGYKVRAAGLNTAKRAEEEGEKKNVITESRSMGGLPLRGT